MATPVGHYLLGLSIAQAFARNNRERKWALLLANIAWFPDLDVLPGLLVGNLGQFHHGATHSLTAAVLFTVAGVLALRWLRKSGILDLTFPFFLIYGSHLVLDLVTLDTGAPYGIPLFWPWSFQTYESPWLLLPNVQHTAAPLISLHNILLAVQEALIFVPLNGAMYGLKTQRSIWPTAVSGIFGAWFVAAVVISVLLLRGF